MIVLDSTIMQKDKPATAGSKILENFISPFDATIVEKLQGQQFERVESDEFGIFPFSSCDNIPNAVKAVADGTAEIALCNDVFGRSRQKAAENNLAYIQPTYGIVSRYGLIPTACSMDRIGIVCKNIPDGFKILSQIAGKDSRDGAMFSEYTFLSETNETLRIGVCSENSIDIFKNTVTVELKHFDIYKQVMYTLAFTEISNNINRYDGIKFGYRTPEYKGISDLFFKTRSEGFSVNTKLASVMGSYVLDNKYYEKAMKLRRLIKESVTFDNYDILALYGDEASELTAIAGLPSLTFNYNGQIIQLLANKCNEHLLLSVWRELACYMKQ